jgi:hypothetical protein
MDDQPIVPLDAPPARERDYSPEEGRRPQPGIDTERPAPGEPPRGGRRSALWLLLALFVVAGLERP